MAGRFPVVFGDLSQVKGKTFFIGRLMAVMEISPYIDNIIQDILLTLLKRMTNFSNISNI